MCALLMAFAFMFGCAGKKGYRSSDDTTAFHRSYQTAYNKTSSTETGNILKKARSALGTPYVRGGSGPDGFDCSGFVRWAYKSAGITLPRSAREQSRIGTPITRLEDMREGDIVAFRHPRRGYHTGIYVGEGKFIHSPRRRSSVRITSLSDPYFNNTFLGARRVALDGSEDLIAQARSRLNDYTEQKVLRDLKNKKKSSKNSNIKQTKRDKTQFVVMKDNKRPTSHVKTSASAKTKKSATTNRGKPDHKSKENIVSDNTHAKSKHKNSRDKAKNS